ncbi:glycosyltransferase family 1 protein [Leptospira jelokensis]|nr:glycosyltransferase family 1 protein [Leptospira jelokensis]
MKVGIDLSNIRSGGGLTHIKEILKVLDPAKFNVDTIIVWGGKKTLDELDNQNWLIKIEESLLNKSILFRVFWQKYILTKRVTKENCHILFVPGGSYSGNFKPFVTMSQNLLPFEPAEINRYKFSIFYFKLHFLKFVQRNTFKKANGVIFLTEFARKRVLDFVEIQNSTIVHHGINPVFFKAPKKQKKFTKYDSNSVIRLLYVSFIGEYKHQWNVIEAVRNLREKGYSIELTFIGAPSEKKAFKKFQKAIQLFDSKQEFVNYYPNVSYSEIHSFYEKADLFVFASSCETFGQILTEAMASGLPILCSQLSAMPELLGRFGKYFDPINVNSLEVSLMEFIDSFEERTTFSEGAYEEAKKFNWRKASDMTFSFITHTYKEFYLK